MNLFNISIKTSRLNLRVPKDKEFEQLGQVVSDGIQKPDEPHFQSEGLYNKTPEEGTKGLKEFVEGHINNWSKEDWQLPFAIFYEDRPIGLITMYSKQFPITRGFGASYWIGLPYQGKGLGTEALNAILTLGFDGLSAREAYCGTWSDNIASLRMMEKLGFVFNGEYWMNRNGEAVKDRRMRLPKESWIKSENISINGLDERFEIFGVCR